jgi:glutathione S-transferase
MLHLYIGNKNYSSWSMRPWVMLRQADIPFQEVMVRFDSFEPDSRFKQTLRTISPTGKVPILLDDAASPEPLAVWDTLAIAEYVAERNPDRNLWPTDPTARALARSACAEMHSGFSALRQACPMNIEALLPGVGALIWRDQAAVRADVNRLTHLWEGLLNRSGGPMLMGAFSIVDAYYAPVCMRLITYGLPVSQTVQAYVERVQGLPAVQAWIRDALAEQDFLPFEEPYRLSR